MSELLIIYGVGCFLTAFIWIIILTNSPAYMHPIVFIGAVLMWPLTVFWFAYDIFKGGSGD